MKYLAEIIFTGDPDDAIRADDRVRDSMTGIQRSVAGLEQNLLRLVAAYGGLRGAQELLRLGKLGEDVLDVERTLQRLTGNAPAALERLRYATHGVGDEFTLTRYAAAAMLKGLSFEETLIVLEAAKLKAKETGGIYGDLGQVFETLTSALARLRQGTGDSSRSLVPLGFYAKSDAELLRLLSKYSTEAGQSLESGADIMDQFNANVKNLEVNLGKLVVRAANMPGAMKDFMEFIAVLAGGKPLMTPEQVNRWMMILGLYDRVKNRPGTTGFIGPLQSPAPPSPDTTRAEALAKIAAAATPLQEARDKLALMNLELQALVKGSDEYIQKQTEIKHQIWAIAEAEKQLVDETKRAQDEAVKADQDQLNQKRAFVKANIALGQATYADLDKLIQEQKGLYQNDLNFQIGILNDLAAVRNNTATQREKKETEYLNQTRDVNAAILHDTSITEAQRLAESLQLWDQTGKAMDFDSDHRRQIQDEIYRAEDALTQYLEREHQRRVQIFEQVFGQPLLSALDRVLMGGKMKFKDFLRDLTRSIVHFLAQTALLRLFSLLTGFGAPAAAAAIGAGMDVGFGFAAGNEGRGGSLGDRFNDLTRSVGISTSNLLRNPSSFILHPSSLPSAAPVINLPPTTVYILATPEGLAATVDTGNHLRRKTDLTR